MSEFINRDRLLGRNRAELPDDPKARKETPIVSGVLDYFPDAIAEVARVSFQGNQQHNPGQPLHWAREKSTDHADCIGRHLLQRGTRDKDGERHSAKLAWRALANLQIEIEEERKRVEISGEPGTVVHIAGNGPEEISYLNHVATDAHDAMVLNSARGGMTL